MKVVTFAFLIETCHLNSIDPCAPSGTNLTDITHAHPMSQTENFTRRAVNKPARSQGRQASGGTYTLVVPSRCKMPGLPAPRPDFFRENLLQPARKGTVRG